MVNSARLARDALLAHCLSKPGAWQDEPWEGDIVAKLPKSRRPIA